MINYIKYLIGGILLLFPIIIYSQTQTGINTKDPKATLDVNGNLIVREPEVLTESSPKSLYIDSKGKVGVLPTDAVTISSPIFYASGTTTNIVEGNSAQLAAFNEGRENYLNFEKADIKYNNIDITQKNGTFEIGESGIYTISSSINIYFSVNASGDNMYVMVGIRKRATASSSWETIVGTRPVIRIDNSPGQNNPVVLPTISTYLEKGNQLQILFYRTAFTGGAVQGASAKSLRIGTSYFTPAYTFSLLKL